MTRNYCGMDFGTSNSTFAVAGGNSPARLLPLEDGKPTIPSAIFFSFESDTVFFGRRAVNEYVTGADGRLMRSIKSVLGTALFADSTRVKRDTLAFVFPAHQPGYPQFLASKRPESGLCNTSQHRGG